MHSRPDYPDYIQPSSKQENNLEQNLIYIAESILSRDCGFLFGAGMSMDSGMPAGKGLAYILLRKLFPKEGSNAPDDDRVYRLINEYPFEAVVQAVQSCIPNMRQELTQLLKDIYLDDSKNPSDAHNNLQSICFAGGARPLIAPIYTTNFDVLLEKAFGDMAIQISSNNVQDIQKAIERGLLPIIHLHGILDDGNYKITEDDVYKNLDILALQFRTTLTASRAFVFVGYSLSDPDFRGLYMDYKAEIESRGELNQKTFVVSPPKDEHSYILSSEVWRARRARLIPLDAKDFFKFLNYFMKKVAVRDIRNSVKHLYNITDEKSLDEHITKTAEILKTDESEALYFLWQSKSKLQRND